MSVIGDFTLPADSFTLAEAMRAEPEMTVEADHLATHSSMEVLPFLWVSDCEFAAGRRALEDDPQVVETEVAERTGDAVLYRVQWVDAFEDLINEMIDHEAAVLDAVATGGTWRMTLRFAEEEQVSRFQRHFREAGRAFEVTHLGRNASRRDRTFGLTTEQHEAMVVALHEGYFDVPRETSAEELGDALDISANAVSQRLRRGNETLVRNALAGADPT